MNISELTQYNPTPTSFPYDDGDSFFGFAGYPNAITNGFILDMNIQSKDKFLLKLITKVYPEAHLASALHYLTDNVSEPVPEPINIHVDDDLLIFSNKHCLTRGTFRIQLKHWNYMRYRYPKCVFLQGRCEHSDILVKDSDKIVGVVTPALWSKT